MDGLKRTLLVCVALALASPCSAQSGDRELGGDIFRSGDTQTPLNAARDVLAAGATVSLDGAVAEDTHAAGFDVDVDAATGGDLLAVGMSVSVGGPVGGDLTASGFSVRTARGASIAGNARLAGARLTLDGPVEGALAAVGAKVTLNAAVAGDALLTGETLTFGPDARVGGTLTYSAPEQVEIPARVAPADRIRYEPYQRSEMAERARHMWEDQDFPGRPDFLSLLGGFLVTLGFFVVIGALCLTLAPATVRHLRERIDARPGMSLVLGTLGLSILFGLVPISAMTVVGIPLVPIVVLVVLLVWTLGYILGTYVLAMRVLRGLGADPRPAIWIRLLALVIGVSIAALLNFIPVLGWMVNFALVLLGIGGMTTALFERLIGNPGPALDVDMRPVEGDER
ncbi:hypothetical protein ILP92_13150 [Maribius pontilimi]|uniref:DUF8173 domain-containing protein n=1 Tax=Palleronia pontilimi TaxID=1964209 RepID=A0A934MDA7_9RHOB|nr:hypothetical protein [Palleronia pontilimi]MBJ3763698.1 hypothetical protein [Palleronia pontilimi]